MEKEVLTTPINRPQTRSRTLSSSSSPVFLSEKRKRSPDQAGNTSKKATTEETPNNSIMRALNAMNARLEKLPTVEHIAKLESDITTKLENSNRTLKQELRSEFKAEIQAQNQKMTKMIAEVQAQVNGASTSAAVQVRTNQQKGRYLRARRSFKIWPITKKREETFEDAIRRFFVDMMAVPPSVANAAVIDTIRPADQARNSKIRAEIIVTFADVETRDALKSYASGLASAKGAAGLRLDVPPCLKGSFKILNDHGMAMMNIYGKDVKRNIKFDDRNQDLMMDLKLPTSSQWHNISIEQAREAKRVRDAVDMQNIRQAAVSRGGVGAMDRDKARALMLSISPEKEKTGNFTSNTGVVHINSEQDWMNFESTSGADKDEDSFESIQEILRGSNARSQNTRRND